MFEKWHCHRGHDLPKAKLFISGKYTNISLPNSPLVILLNKLLAANITTLEDVNTCLHWGRFGSCTFSCYCTRDVESNWIDCSGICFSQAPAVFPASLPLCMFLLLISGFAQAHRLLVVSMDRTQTFTMKSLLVKLPHRGYELMVMVPEESWE